MRVPPKTNSRIPSNGFGERPFTVREPKFRGGDTSPSAMESRAFFRYLSIGLVSVSCKYPGQGPPPNASRPGDANSVSVSDTTKPETDASSGLPKACSAQGSFCALPGDFVERLCGGKYPDLAIVWFTKGTPWTRRYVKAAAVEPRNAPGGPASEDKLVKGEEVLILRQQGGGDAKASGSVDYDVLRWDGTCAALSDSQMTDKALGQPKNALIGWRYLDVRIQRALFKDAAIAKAQLAVTNACKGSTGHACTYAIHNLSAAIASAVRKGLELPAPARTP